MPNRRSKVSRFREVRPYRSARLDRSNLRWSPRDWRVFRASCSMSPRQREVAVEVVSKFRSGVPVSEIAEPGVRSKQYVYVILASEDLRDANRMANFFAGRRNLGRPLDVGGPRDEWVDYDVIDDQDDEYAVPGF